MHSRVEPDLWAWPIPKCAGAERLDVGLYLGQRAYVLGEQLEISAQGNTTLGEELALRCDLGLPRISVVRRTGSTL